ncbi:acetamidase [Methylobacterium sp. Leaf113]|uniref:acetamidase/formamidase family protein n=1 Tax=unclassified Methylobacterium TaxID=2615210 RepID=UPI0006F68967|nr:MULTISPECIES: acetamidase/formamidase family protein [unclassified Methylobacterium]KQP80432.1 acetamidase [Methylobacterium sp. Leaf117]KQP91619.1 acetamidase [Methylobacterium sp. Leaf113]
MCQGDDPNCVHFVEHRARMLDDLAPERRSFLKSGFVASGAAATLMAGGLSLPGPTLAQASARGGLKQTAHYHLPATAETVHWGYFSRSLKPQVEIESGDYVTIETLTHHANDDAERMVTGDPGAESVFLWTKDRKGVVRRGAGPEETKFGPGGGLGVHICTGPVAIRGAEPGDVLEVRILDVAPRPCANPAFKGRTFGSNAAANWGYHYKDMITGDRPREVVTIYEVDASGARDWAQAVYSFRWPGVIDPNGVAHPTIDYPGLPVDHTRTIRNVDVLKGFRIPIRPHFGTMGLAPKEAEMVNSIPPSYTGGNIDNWRIGKGATLYYPVAVPGALFSVGDPHASQGDSELCGTAIECSLTGTFQFILHKKRDLPGTALETLDFPMIETADDWVLSGFSYPNYLADLGPDAQNAIFAKSSIDLAMRDAFRKMRQFLMHGHGLTEDETISLMSVAVDFGITQVVDGNWGVHAIVKKSIFPVRTT